MGNDVRRGDQVTNLVTLRERKSQFIVALKNQSRHAHSTANVLLKYMSNKLRTSMQTLTLDNDPALALT